MSSSFFHEKLDAGKFFNIYIFLYRNSKKNKYDYILMKSIFRSEYLTDIFLSILLCIEL